MTEAALKIGAAKPSGRKRGTLVQAGRFSQVENCGATPGQPASQTSRSRACAAQGPRTSSNLPHAVTALKISIAIPDGEGGPHFAAPRIFYSVANRTSLGTFLIAFWRLYFFFPQIARVSAA